jgi:hypothetical protein
MLAWHHLQLTFGQILYSVLTILGFPKTSCVHAYDSNVFWEETIYTNMNFNIFPFDSQNDPHLENH